MEKVLIAVLRAVALLCLGLAVISVGAAIVKGRSELLALAFVFYVVRAMLLSTARDEEVYLIGQGMSNEKSKEE